METGLQPFFLDLDAVLLADPLPLLRLLPEADILISSDQLFPTETRRGLEACPPANMHTYHMGYMNVGMHLMRPGAGHVLEVVPFVPFKVLLPWLLPHSSSSL